MNWDAIGAVGENIGALAVVVSVAYLALQISKQTAESRLAAARDLSNIYITTLRSLREDQEMCSLFLKAIQDYDDLPNNERYRVSLLMQEMFRVNEQQFVHTRQQKADPIFVESINLSFEEFLTFPGTQRWWEICEEMFVPEFRDHVNKKLESAKDRGYQSSFKV
jgi:hypothetical protein